MSSPRDYYKSIHPEYFSDSEVEEVSELDRTLLEYHLHSITGRSQEADFERFARRLCEREVCPNLLPTTGPTGGGDSKADAETFPVADSLALKWYSGLGSKASQERWAFAFSAKSAWVPKVQSDVKKIVETGRGYTKVFFVTNQSVPAKKRAKVEDDLRVLNSIDVRILDRTWILERVFTGRHEDIAVSELKLQALSKPRERVGPADAARASELTELEARIDAAVAAGSSGPPLVDDALDAADVCRSLERPRAEVEGRYARADRLALAHGTLRQQVEAAYQWGWTLFWWFEDVTAATTQYEIVERRAKDADNVYDLERLSTLYTVLRTYALSNGDEQLIGWVQARRPALRSALERVSVDEDRPSVSLRAKTLLLQDDLYEAFYSNSNPACVFDELGQVVERSKGLVGFPVDPLVKLVTVVGKLVDDNPSYNALFEAVVEAASLREGEVRAARLLLDRGDQLLDRGRWASAIVAVGQALGRLYKHETRRDIVYALFLCARAYERLGLLWAARGTYLAGASIAANDFHTYGTVSRGLTLCANALKWLELRLGRLPQVLAWHELDLSLCTGLGGEIGPGAAEREAGFEILLGRLILRTPFEHLAVLGRMPDVLDRLALSLPSALLLFLLGYPERLEEITGEDGEEIFDPTRLWSIESDVPLPDHPELSVGESVTLSTRILGCRVTLTSATAEPCVEVAESILAALESLISTGAIKGAMAFESDLTMEVRCGTPDVGILSMAMHERIGRPHLLVECQAVAAHELSAKSQAEMREAVLEAAVTALAQTIRFPDMDAGLRQLFEGERVAERAGAFTCSIGPVRNVLGSGPKFRLSAWWEPDATEYKVVRSEPWVPTVRPLTTEQPRTAQEPVRPGTGEPPQGLFDPERIAHDRIEVISPIRMRLWDRAEWSGAFFMSDEANSLPPVLGLMFRNQEAAAEIFSGWLAEFGRVVEQGQLRLTIVRGIDKGRPHAYRVLIGSGFEPDPGDRTLFMMMQRINLMDATDPANLNRFLAAYDIHKRFLLVPAYMRDGTPYPDLNLAIGMLALNVRNAWEIGRHDPDCAGVLGDDNVIVPDDVENPPVRELQEWKRRHTEEE